MIRELDFSDRQEVLETLNLQRAGYAVEAALIGTSEIPPLQDTAETLERCGETFYGYFVGERLVGAVSYKEEDGALDIHRLVVHPEHFRRGIGRSLLGHIEWIAGNVDRIVVSTGAKNTPAKRLYRSMGFREVGEIEPVPGVRVTAFEKALNGARRP